MLWFVFSIFLSSIFSVLVFLRSHPTRLRRLQPDGARAELHDGQPVWHDAAKFQPATAVSRATAKYATAGYEWAAGRRVHAATTAGATQPTATPSTVQPQVS